MTDLVKKRIVKGVTWSVLGMAVFRILNVFSMILAARILGVENYGELGVVRSTLEMFSLYASFGLGTTATKYVSELRHSDSVRMQKIISLVLLLSFFTCAVVSFLILILSAYLSTVQLNNINLINPIRIGCLFVFFSMYGYILESILLGFEKYREIAAVNVMKGLFTLIFFMIMSKNFSVSYALFSLVIAHFLVFCFYVSIIVKLYIKNNYTSILFHKNFISEWKILGGFALPGMITGTILTFTVWKGVAILSAVPDGYREVGLFSAANQLRVLIIFLPIVVSRALLPIMSNVNSSCEVQYKKIVVDNIFSVWMFVLPISMLFILFGDKILLVFGRDYGDAVRLIPLLFSSLLFYSVSEIMKDSLISAGRIWIVCFYTIIYSFTYIMICYYFIPKYGAIGLVFAILFSQIIIFILKSFSIISIGGKKYLYKWIRYFFLSVVLIFPFVYMPLSDFENVKLLWLILLISFFPIFLLIWKNFYKSLSQ